MNLVVRSVDAVPETQEIEVVERKGTGHPDTICDALAEQICVRLCHHYRERFGVILHHNVDKILLCGGAARPELGGGEVTAPIELYLAGRATLEHRGEQIHVDELAIEACREWLRANFHALDPEAHVQIIPRFKPGSRELISLFGEKVLANDTSCGVGFAPLTALERVVLEVERALNSADTKRSHPAMGQDIKVMGVRRGTRIELTIGCAMIGRFLSSADEYVQMKTTAVALACEAARRTAGCEVDAVVNAADDLARGDLFVTVTGTSAEAGDDGEVGRGNRACGLITPHRPMTMEAVAGKNPVNHVGKLYNLMAIRIAQSIVRRVDVATSASCLLVSRIGHPIDDPQIADVRLGLKDGATVEAVRDTVSELLSAELGRFPELLDSVLAGRLSVY